jgi:Xaa-Pro aminopeptidase
MPTPHERRRTRLLDRLAERDLAAALVSDLVNVRYLTGFTGSSGALLLVRGLPPVLATDGRYVGQAAQETELEPRLVKGDAVVGLWGQAREILGNDVYASLRQVGLETDSLTHDRYLRLLSQDADVELLSLDGAVQALRTVKDDVEIAALREACAISTLALEQLVAGRVLGCTERQLRAHPRGRDARTRAPRPWAFRRSWQPGPTVPFRTTSRLTAHWSVATCSRSTSAPAYAATTRTARDIRRRSRACGLAGGPARGRPRGSGRRSSSTVRRGAATSDVDAAVVESLRGAGLADRFVHGLGHGVGLEIHEDPFLGSTSTGMLGDCTAITIEPGVYLPGRGGVRIEDTLVVRDGGPEVLTTAARGLRVVG